MRARSKQHFIDTFQQTGGTIGGQLLCRAIYVARYGRLMPGGEFNTTAMSSIFQEFDMDGYFSMTSDEAIDLVESQITWQEAIGDDPIPGWAIEGLSMKVGGRDVLADHLETSETTISRWCNERRRPRGPAAAALRMLCEKVAEEK